jgi:hypothetical protein
MLDRSPLPSPSTSFRRTATATRRRRFGGVIPATEQWPCRTARKRVAEQGSEAARNVENAVGDERVHVGVEVDQIAEGLHEEDEARPGARRRGAVRLHEQSGDDAAELSEKRAAVSEERPDELRNGEDILPVRNGPQHATLDPFAVGEDALLMAARAEVARLAGEGEQQIVTAAAAADARKAAVQVAALEKALEHVLLDGAAHATRGAQLRQVATDALPQRTCARSARAIDRRAIGLHTATNARAVAADEYKRWPDDMAVRRSTRPAAQALKHDSESKRTGLLSGIFIYSNG